MAQDRIRVSIDQDCLIAPQDDLHALFLKVHFPDGSYSVTGVRRFDIDRVVAHVRETRGVDLMSLILAEIERHVTSDHSYRLRMPDHLVALLEQRAAMAVAAE